MSKVATLTKEIKCNKPSYQIGGSFTSKESLAASEDSLLLWIGDLPEAGQIEIPDVSGLELEFE